MAVTSQLIGLKEANRALRALPDTVKPNVQQVMDVTASNVARRAQASVRRRTGRLARSIAWQRRPRTVAAVVGVAPEGFYWKFLEYGTVKMEAVPFFRPAAEAEQSAHQEAIVRALDKANTTMERAASSASSRLL